MKKLESSGLITKTREQYFTNFSLKPGLYEKKISELLFSDNIPIKENNRFNKKVISTFMSKGKINQFPRQHKKRLVLLEEIMKHFLPGKIYQETEIDATLKNIFEDHCTLRRMLIDEGFMNRENGQYQITSNPVEQDAIANEENKVEKISGERKKELQMFYKEKKIPMGVYKITNKINGKIYIGATQNIEGRFNRYEFSLKMGIHQNKELQKDWNEYGKDNFTFEVIEEFKNENGSISENSRRLEKLKSKWLEKLEPFGEKGYNTKSIKPTIQ